MFCRKCGAEIPDESIRCSSCGVKVNMHCPKCKTLNSFGTKTCKNCGFELLKVCSDCGASNLYSAKECRKCKKSFIQEEKKEECEALQDNVEQDIVRSFSSTDPAFIPIEESDVNENLSSKKTNSDSISSV